MIQEAQFVNPQNSHNGGNLFSSKVGGVSGCGGSPDSSCALKGAGIFNMVKTGGKKTRKTRKINKRRHKGGNGFGFSKSQSLLATTSGVRGAVFDKYINNGQISDTNMGTSSQSGGKKRRISTTKYKRKSLKKRKTRKNIKNKKTIKNRKNRKTKIHKKSSHKQKGGYSQYMSGVANSFGYSTGGVLSNNESALANPTPVTPYSDCRDNYNHFKL